jgi:Flp pilus assembly protein CpaB
VLAVVHELGPPDPRTTSVVVAARDVPSGERLKPDDLRIERLRPSQVPDGAATSVTALDGEQVTVPLRSGEVVTDARLLSSALVGQYGAGLVATPVRLPDADVVALLETGDLVDVYAATGDATRAADRVVIAAPVVSVPASFERSGDGAIVVLALDERETARLAQASVTTQLSISLR